MAADPPPAEFEVAVLGPNGVQKIYSCSLHLAHTVRALRKLKGMTAAVKDADPAVHGCKGHLDDWPVS